MPLLLAHKLGSLCNPYYIIDYETLIPVRCFPPFDMDIKTLLDNLHDEVPCSVCKCKFANLKQLPCLRSWSVQRSRSFWDSRYRKQNYQKLRIFCNHSKKGDIVTAKHVKIPFCNWLNFRKLIKISCKETICETFLLCLLLCFPPLDMDIKTLLDNLHEEVSCSVCMCKFTDPKQLPCLHSFCLQCLNGIQRTSANPNVIDCVPWMPTGIQSPWEWKPTSFAYKLSYQQSAWCFNYKGAQYNCY